TSGQISAQIYGYAGPWHYFSQPLQIADFSSAATGSGAPLPDGGGTGTPEPPPLSLSAAAIPYGASVGDVLAIPGGAAPDPTAPLTYQWQDLRADGPSANMFVNIPGATGPTYAVMPTDIASFIRVVVTATGTDGTTLSTISNIDAPNLATQIGSELD